MAGDQLGHFEHADLLLTVEHGLQIFVGIDEGPLFCILQPILADVGPKFFRQLRPWKRFVTDNLGELMRPALPALPQAAGGNAQAPLR